jgi:hypothetical protein
MNTKYFSSREREREKVATHEKATDWVEERNKLSKTARKREREREREKEKEKRTNQVSRSQIGRSYVDSLASRISCRRRRLPAPTLLTNF